MPSSTSVEAALVHLASRLAHTAKMLSSKPERPLLGDVARAYTDTQQAGLALVQQARALYLFDVLDANQDEAHACIDDLDKKAAVYVTCAKLFLSCCRGAPRKLAAKPCADVLKATAQLCTKTAARSANAAHVGMIDAAMNAVTKVSWRVEVAAALLLGESEGLLKDAVEEFDEAVHEAGQPANDKDDDEEDTCNLLRHAPLTSATRILLGLALQLTSTSRERLVLPSITACASDDLDETANTLVTCAAALTTQADALVCALAHEDDAEETASQAGSFGKLLQRTLTAANQLASIVEGNSSCASTTSVAELQDVVARCIAAAHDAGSVAVADHPDMHSNGANGIDSVVEQVRQTSIS